MIGFLVVFFFYCDYLYVCILTLFCFQFCCQRGFNIFSNISIQSVSQTRWHFKNTSPDHGWNMYVRFRCIVTEFLTPCWDQCLRKKKIVLKTLTYLILPEQCRFSLCIKSTGNDQLQSVSWLFTAGTVSTSFYSSVQCLENTPMVWWSMQFIYYPYKCNTSKPITLIMTINHLNMWLFIFDYEYIWHKKGRNLCVVEYFSSLIIPVGVVIYIIAKSDHLYNQV